MAQARPLYDILAGLTGEDVAGAAPGEALRAAGHDLPDALIAEAIVSFAGTAPVEVAEHLAPFVTAHGPVPPADPAATAPELADGLALLASAPTPDLADLEAEAALPGSAGAGAGDAEGASELSADPFDLDFGGGDTGEGDPGGAAVVPEVFGAFDPVVPEAADPFAPVGEREPAEQVEPFAPADRPSGEEPEDLAGTEPDFDVG